MFVFLLNSTKETLRCKGHSAAITPVSAAIFLQAELRRHTDLVRTPRPRQPANPAHCQIDRTQPTRETDSTQRILPGPFCAFPTVPARSLSGRLWAILSIPPSFLPCSLTSAAYGPPWGWSEHVVDSSASAAAGPGPPP